MLIFNSNGLESLYMNLKIMDFCILYRVKKKTNTDTWRIQASISPKLNLIKFNIWFDRN